MKKQTSKTIELNNIMQTIFICLIAIAIILFADSCTSVKNFKNNSCSGNKSMSYYGGYSRSKFKY